jgi:cyclopropane fatty-acyl-phospholipid synthase-like methyltransferase
MSVLLARFYLREQALWKRLRGFGEAAHTGAWLGLLSPRALHAVDEAFYAGSRTYLSDAHNLKGLLPWEQAAVREFFPAGGRLLLIGAGGGREVLALARMGYAVVGVECNEALVDYGNELLAREGVDARLAVVPRDRAPETGGPYDGAIVGWGAYMLMMGRPRRVEFLRQLRALLPAGAPVLMSFFTRPEDHPRMRKVHAIASRLRRLTRREPLELGDDLAPTFVHRFTRGELASELEAAGFRLAHFVEETGPYEPGWAIGAASG